MKRYYRILRAISNNIPYEVRRRHANEWMIPTILGIGFGVAAGVGLGLLLAPAAGTETRRQLKDGANRMKDRALEAAHKVRHRADEIATAAQNGTDRTFLNEAR